LVAGQDYFDDRAAMNAVIDKSILEVIQTPSLPLDSGCARASWFKCSYLPFSSRFSFYLFGFNRGGELAARFRRYPSIIG